MQIGMINIFYCQYVRIFNHDNHYQNVLPQNVSLIYNMIPLTALFFLILEKVITLPSSVSIHLLQVELYILLVTWPHKATPFKCHTFLLVRGLRSMSPS